VFTRTDNLRLAAGAHHIRSAHGVPPTISRLAREVRRVGHKLHRVTWTVSERRTKWIRSWGGQSSRRDRVVDRRAFVGLRCERSRPRPSDAGPWQGSEAGVADG